MFYSNWYVFFFFVIVVNNEFMVFKVLYYKVSCFISVLYVLKFGWCILIWFFMLWVVIDFIVMDFCIFRLYFLVVC